MTLSRLHAQPRSKTIDDESLPNAFKSPTKLLALHESRKLEHSRSSNDLKSPPQQNEFSIENSGSENPIKVRPPVASMRRRSTLNWSNALPRVRQKKLEDVAAVRLADTWFSLHCADISEPIYVSEVIDKAMNPSFRAFDLNVYGSSVTRHDELIVKIWARTEKKDDYILLIELRLHFRSLQFIGKSVRHIISALPL